MSLEKMNRNREILLKFRNGWSYSDLADYYDVSIPRIRQILDHVRLEEHRRAIDIPEIGIACLELHAYRGMCGRIMSALKNRNLDKKNRWRKLSRIDILKIQKLGDAAADIIEYAQKI